MGSEVSEITLTVTPIVIGGPAFIQAYKFERPKPVTTYQTVTKKVLDTTNISSSFCSVDFILLYIDRYMETETDFLVKDIYSIL